MHFSSHDWNKLKRNATHTNAEMPLRKRTSIVKRSSKKKKKKSETQTRFSALSKRRLHVSHLKVPKCIESLRLLLTNMFD